MFSKKTISTAALAGAMLLSLVLPVVASAQTMPSIWPTGYWADGGLLSCTGNYIAAQTSGTKACQSLNDLIQTILNITAFIMSIAIFIVMPVFFAWGAILLMLGGAQPEMLSKGKKVLTGTIIGLAIILCSYLIIATLCRH